MFRINFKIKTVYAFSECKNESRLIFPAFRHKQLLKKEIPDITYYNIFFLLFILK